MNICKTCKKEFTPRDYKPKARTCQKCLNNKLAAKHLYNLLDGICGMVSEQGMDSLDRYMESGYSTFIWNVNHLGKLDWKLYKKFVKEAISYGILHPSYK